MLVSEYKTAIRRQLGLSDTDAVVSDAVLLWALNGALQKISTDKDWPWLYTEATVNTVAGDATYALPTGYTRSAFITVDGGNPIEPSTFTGLAHDRTTTGAPYGYVIEGTDLRLYPTPDSVTPIVHAYYQSEPELTDDGDEPLLPDAYSEWAVLEAAIKVALRTNHLTRLQSLREEAAEVRRGVLDNYRRASAPGRIRRTRPPTWPWHI